MNLKRLRGIATVALITIAAALFAGCSNSMAGSVDGGSNARMATLSLSATGIPEEYAKEFDAYCKSVESQRLASRSILPDDPFDIDKVGNNTNGGQSENLAFVLTGKSETGMKYKATQVFLGTKVTENSVDLGYDFVLNTTNNTPVTMDAMSWALTLTAYKGFMDIDNPGDAVLIGYCSVDLRKGSGAAQFKMGIAGLDTVADVTLGKTIVDVDKVAKSFKMGIYRKVDLKAVDATSSKVNGTTATNTTEVKYDIVDGDYQTDETIKFEYAVTGIAPGTYLYTVVFYNKAGCAGNVVGSFTDTIVINPGNVLTDDSLRIDVIGKMPTIPTNLKAKLVPNSESTDGSTYKVSVTWGESSYVTNYELNLVEYDKNYADGDSVDPDDIDDAFETNFAVGTDATKGYTGIEDGQIYGMASMDDSDPKEVKDFPGSTVYGTGSDSSLMMYGDTSCVLTLETGKLYEIQLRARSYYGVSGWANRVKSTDTDGYDEPSVQRINRTLITYNLNGGALQLGTGADKTYDIYTNYVSWKENDNLLVIGGADNNTLNIDGSVDFVEWLLEDGIAANPTTDPDVLVKTAETSVTKYTYKNVAVKASFGNKVTGNITQDEKPIDIDVKDILIAYGAENNPAANTVKDTGEIGNTFTIPRTGDERSLVVLEIKPTGVTVQPSGAVIKYSNVKVQVWGQSDERKTTVSKDAGKTGTNYYVIDTRKYPAGKVCVMVTADTDNAKGVSQTFILDVQ